MFGTGSFLSHLPARECDLLLPQAVSPSYQERRSVHKEKVLESKASCLPPLTFAQPGIPKGSPWPPLGPPPNQRALISITGLAGGGVGAGKLMNSLPRALKMKSSLQV